MTTLFTVLGIVVGFLIARHKYRFSTKIVEVSHILNLIDRAKNVTGKTPTHLRFDDKGISVGVRGDK